MNKRETKKRLRLIRDLSEEFDIPRRDLWWILSDDMIRAFGLLSIGAAIFRTMELVILLRLIESLRDKRDNG